MDYRDTFAKQRDYVETTLADYTSSQKQEVYGRLPSMRLEQDELVQFVAEKKKAFDAQATPEELEKVFKDFRI
jgi:formate-dependent nitrite reductase cytochrome c552 subunit